MWGTREEAVTLTPSGATPAIRNVTIQLATIDDLTTLRRFVGGAAASAGLTPDAVARLVVSVNEIATNAVTHGVAPVSVTVTVTATAVTVTVNDRGHGFGQDVPVTADPDTGRLIAAAPPAADALHGRGLWLATQMTDQVSLTTGSAGTTVTVVMALGAERHPR
jgi:serine/threonine-protein kinase RsbW